MSDQLLLMECPYDSNLEIVNWREIFMKQSVGKCKYINF